MVTREDVESFLIRMDLEYQELEEGMYLVRSRNGGPPMVVNHSPPLLLLRVKVMDLPEGAASMELFRTLLELNASDVVHGAYGLEEQELILSDTLELETLDFHELQASLESMQLAASGHIERIRNLAGAGAGLSGGGGLTMGIFQKLSTVLRSNINDLISRAENPEKMLNQIILDMRDQLARAKREVAAAIADERKLRQQLDDEVKQTRDWEQRAMLAVREGRDGLAKQALVRQQEHAERAGALEQTWRSQASETEKLKGSLRQLNDKIDEAKRKRNLLIAKQKRAQAQRRIHETMSGLSDSSAFDAFNRMAEKIEETERRQLAAVEVDQALAVTSVEEEFLQLEKGHAGGAVEDRLLALKQQMGLLPSAGGSEPRQLNAGEGRQVQDGEVEVEEEGPAPPAAAQRKAGSDAELIEEFDRLGKAAES